MLSMVVMAQTFVVVDKNGNRVTYDVSKIDKVTFQEDPPGFTVYENVDEPTSGSGQGNDPGQGSDPGQGQGNPEEPVQEVTTFTFDEVKSFSGDPDFLFVHPDTVYVGAETEYFRFQFRANVAYDYKLSESWINYSRIIADTDSLEFEASLNPSTEKRKGFIVFLSKDEQMRDTLFVVQAGKRDSRYIDIDWANTTLDSFNEETGQAKLTFKEEVPVMGDYDVVLLPKDGDYVIRLIDEVKQEKDSKTVTLATRQGLMGNLFKDTKFTLATDAGAKSRGRTSDTGPIYTPTKVEVFTGDEYVEVFNADKALSRGKAPVGFENEFFSWEYNQDGAELWSSGMQSLSWDKLNFNIGLKGVFSFDFGDVEFEKVRMGDLQNLKITLEGGFDMAMVMKYLVSSSVEWKKEWTLKEDVFKAKYTFTVGTVPVYISVGADLMAEVSLGASGEASITSGITASNTVTYGVEWDAEKGLSKIAECEKKLEMVGPNVDIKAHAEARATCYPKIEIGIYKVLCPTISPQPYIKAEADGRLVENEYVAWNAGVSTGVDLGLGLCLDLFFWKKDLGEIDPINVFDLPIVSLPDEIELLNEPEEEVLIEGKREVKYHVTNKINLTGKTYNAPGVLVHFEAEGGELEDEYGYTDKEGNVTAFFTLTDPKGGVVKAEVVLGAEGEEPEEGEEADDEDAIKADDWKAIAIDHRLTPSPASQNIEKDAEAAIIYKLERYTSKTGEWTGFGGQTIQFEATGGTVAPATAVTAQDGTVTVTFTPEADATEGKVTASTSGKDPDAWTKVSSATIKIGSNGGDDVVIDDEGLKKAAKQKDNVYVIEDKSTGETETREYKPQMSEWVIDDYKPETPMVQVMLEDADENGYTLGGMWAHIPLTMVGVVQTLTPEFLQNNPDMKIMFDKYEGNQVSANAIGGTQSDHGNLSLDGSSKFLLREVTRSNGARRMAPEYTGEYEFLFYFVFKNQTYNYETDKMEEGDDYEVYGRGIMSKHVPSITSFELTPESNYVKVGNSVVVDVKQYYEASAEWDWNDVELVGQSNNYADVDNEDLGFFKWDSASHTLTSVKSNDNKSVILKFALKSKPTVNAYMSIDTGEGWPYTSFEVSPAEQTVSTNGSLSFSVKNWQPSTDEAWDSTCLEIDPESDSTNTFKLSINPRYYDYGYLYIYQSKPVPGEYNLRFRLRSDHSIGATMKITITND